MTGFGDVFWAGSAAGGVGEAAAGDALKEVEGVGLAAAIDDPSSGAHVLIADKDTVPKCVVALPDIEIRVCRIRGEVAVLECEQPVLVHGGVGNCNVTGKALDHESVHDGIRGAH